MAGLWRRAVQDATERLYQRGLIDVQRDSNTPCRSTPATAGAAGGSRKHIPPTSWHTY
jgi:hypothetical protein